MKIICIAVICLLISSFCIAQHPSKYNHLPDIVIKDIKGRPTTLAALGNGKVTFVDNWYIPCPPCYAAIGMLHRLYDKYRTNPKFNFVSICRTDPEIVKMFLAKDPRMKEGLEFYRERSKLNYFKLPLYFIPGCNAKTYVSGIPTPASTKPDEPDKCAEKVFNFNGYPTLLIYDKKGKLIFKKTGFNNHFEKSDQEKLEKILDALLTNN